MSTLKPLYGTKTSLPVTGFNSLGDSLTAESDAFDNSTNLFQDVLVEINVAGTAAANAFVEVRLAASEDGSSFGTFESAIPLGTVSLSATPQVAHFTLL